MNTKRQSISLPTGIVGRLAKTQRKSTSRILVEFD
jgi:hypothetical protein